MYRCIASDINSLDLDESPFLFNHSLQNHESLTLDNLSKVLVELPKKQVMYSKGLTDLCADFDNAHINQKNNLSLEETIETLKTSSSYIMVRSPETDPSFHDIYNDLLGDVNKIMKSKGVGKKAIDPTLFLFIASPNAFTPFHIDRYSTFLFQFRGSKEIAVFDKNNPEIVNPVAKESYVDSGKDRPEWRDDLEQYAEKFQFNPGQALHIPFVAGHYVKNGPEDISISMSIIFRTNESKMLMEAMMVNNRLRKKLSKIGLTVSPIGSNRLKDNIKSKLYPLIEGINKIRR